jgi:pantoate--beta-alanine ligase
VRVVTTRAELARELAPARRSGRRIGLVPTMGALHEGHLSLCDEGRARAAVVVLSIFVNPLQFGPGEDLARYPRNLRHDTVLARERGVDLVFAPGVEEVYPDPPTRVYVTAPALADRLCGAYRPGHFDGVLTVVAKLFHMVMPDVAVFGQKDLQQAALIRRMVLDLDFPVEVRVGRVVRDRDGLALSSRNAYLSPSERRSALALSRALRLGRSAWQEGERNGLRLLGVVRDEIEREAGVRVQYLELVDATSLEPLDTARAGAALAVAAFVGETRLIDNMLLDDET